MSASLTDPLLLRAAELVLQHLPEKPTFWLKPPGSLQPFNRDSPFFHPWYPEHQRLLASGWQKVEMEGGIAKFDGIEQAVVFGGKLKEENRQLLRALLSSFPNHKEVFFALPNDYGGKSFGKELSKFVEVQADFVGRKSRLFRLRGQGGEAAPLVALEKNKAGYLSTPGLFGWDKVDRGSSLLIEALKTCSLSGPIVDLGSGWGYLSAQMSPKQKIHLVEADQRGVEASRQNLPNHKATFHWMDATSPELPRLVGEKVGTVICNPPFHTGKKAEPELGQAFIASANRLLSKNGSLYLVANSHLPYSKMLREKFRSVEILVRKDGFTVYTGTSLR